jgi:S1-C subfamily serine protease
MKKAPLYSRSRSPSRAESAPSVTAASAPAADGPANPAALATSRGSRFKAAMLRRERWFWAGVLMLLLVAGLAPTVANRSKPPVLTMAQIDAAMRQSIEDKPLSSAAARAYEAILPSVVRVVGLMTDGDDGNDKKGDDMKGMSPFERGVGTGVVIIDNGTILTNLHVVSGAKRIKVTFMDGTESDAVVLSVQPQNDLAVLRAKTIPDDLEAATMRSTTDLAVGDQVLAVGFPFGIGPSASAGVVSGLKREFRSPEGQQKLTNLIQFDAAANPGNSGGPLVTMDGEVVGIVTAILNPSRQRVFIGIGFAVPIENAASAAGMSPF